MRLFLPTQAICKRIVKLLGRAFDKEDIDPAMEAVYIWTKYYQTAVSVKWLIEDMPEDHTGTYLGMCTEDGHIELIHPTIFKRVYTQDKGKPQKIRRINGYRTKWIKMVIYELSHLVTIAYPETRAVAMEDAAYKRGAK